MRNAFSDTLVELAQADPNVLLLTGDHGYALFDPFRRHCPAQYINAGIAEQNMVGMAAGLARAGFRPVRLRAERVRAGARARADQARRGARRPAGGLHRRRRRLRLQPPRHQPPVDRGHRLHARHPAARGATRRPTATRWRCACAPPTTSRSPVYLRMGKSDRGDVHPAPLPARPRRPARCCACARATSRRLALVATGSMVRTALDLAESAYPDAAVWSVPVIKPVDAGQVAALCAASDLVVTLEEHSVIGGLGSLVAEIAAERAPTRVLRIGVHDRYLRALRPLRVPAAASTGSTPTSVRARIDAFLPAPPPASCRSCRGAPMPERGRPPSRRMPPAADGGQGRIVAPAAGAAGSTSTSSPRCCCAAGRSWPAA